MGIFLQAKLNSLQQTERFNQYETDELFLKDGVIKFRKIFMPKKTLKSMIFIKDEETKNN